MVRRIAWVGAIPLVLVLSLLLYDSDVVEVLVGALASIWATLLFEAVRSPSLSIVPYNQGACERFRAGRYIGWVVQLHLRNAPLPGWLSFLQRSALVDAGGTITFRDPAGRAIRKAMPIRWSASPQPGHRFEEVSAESRESRYVVDSDRLVSRWSIPALPNGDGVIAVAARYEQEKCCFGYTNESYSTDFHPAAWRLDPGEYLVDIQISAPNGSARDAFLLSCHGPDGSTLCLEEIPAGKKRALLRRMNARD
jgi:hypothetical protein